MKKIYSIILGFRVGYTYCQSINNIWNRIINHSTAIMAREPVSLVWVDITSVLDFDPHTPKEPSGQPYTSLSMRHYGYNWKNEP